MLQNPQNNMISLLLYNNGAVFGGRPVGRRADGWATEARQYGLGEDGEGYIFGGHIVHPSSS